MESLIEKAEELLLAIKRQEKEIDNPALVMSIRIELDNFIENLKED